MHIIHKQLWYTVFQVILSFKTTCYIMYNVHIQLWYTFFFWCSNVCKLVADWLVVKKIILNDVNTVK